MATATKAKSTAKKTVRFDPAEIKGHGKQLRHRGEDPEAYKIPISLIKKAAKSEAGVVAYHALIHHGWHRGADAPVSKKEKTLHGVADKAIYDVGQPVGPQLAATFQLLMDEGVEPMLLDALWDIYTGSPV